jgi:N-hydroxyarylamine O-acetyltransferase
MTAGWRLDVDRYLERTAYRGPREPARETLRGLHAAHRRTVPYENLDVTRRRPVPNDPQALFQKIVVRRRGGWCHEQNRLFALLLRELGFSVGYRSACVHPATGQVTPEFSHLVLVVQLEERWLADVGFGARGPAHPLRLDAPGQVQRSGRDAYLVDPDPRHPGRRMVSGRWQDGWAPLYSVDPRPRRLEEFDARCAQQQTEPSWIERRMASIMTPDGRVSLDGARLIVTRDGVRDERTLASDADYRAALRHHFGITLDP